MNIKQVWFWKKAITLFSVLLLLNGCNHPCGNFCRDSIFCTPCAANKILQEGSDGNYKIKKANVRYLPATVKRSLMSGLTNGSSEMAQITVSRFDLVAEDVPAKTFFLSLVQDTPYNVTVHPEVQGKISLQLKRVTVPEVLKTVRSVYGYDFRQIGQNIEVLPITLQTRAFHVDYLDVHRDGKSEMTITGSGLTTAPQNGTGTGNSTTGTTATALPSGASIIGGTPSNGQPVTSSIVDTTLKTDFWKEIKTSVEAIVGSGEGRRVEVSPMSSMVIVQAMPEELRKVAEFLKSSELNLNRQVILEAKILEVELNDTFQAGINWALVSGRLRLTQTGGRVIRDTFDVNDDFPHLVEQINLVQNPVNISPGVIGGAVRPTFDNATNVGPFGGVFALALNSKNMGDFIELLSAQGNIHVLSSPRVSTINNQKALIKVGKDQFFITNINSSQTIATGSSSTTSLPTPQFNSFFSGIALDVTPHISEGDNVTLHIHPTITQVKNVDTSFIINDQLQTLPLAASTVRESDSMVRARNGEMVIIGGLMQELCNDVKEGIPILKDLPFIGNLFHHTQQKSRKSELVILLKPIVVENSTWSDLIDESQCRFKELEKEERKNEFKYRKPCPKDCVN